MATDNLKQSRGAERITQENDEGAIQCNSYGGLNTTANPLNIPYEDSPLMTNVDMDTSGAIIKRKGTRVLSRDSNTTRTLTLMPVSTQLAYNLLCVKRGTSLVVYEVNNNIATAIITKSNVWSSAAENDRSSWVLTSETTPRLLIMNSRNKPVQVSFIEKQTTSSGGTSVVFSSASQIQAASTSNCIVWVNRVRYTGSVIYTWNAGAQTQTLTLGTALTSGDVVDVTLVCWQWWAEAQHWRGDRLYGSETRFNAVPADQVVKIPVRLTTDLDPAETSARSWYMWAWIEGKTTAGAYNRVSAGNPTASTDYWFSDGKRYVPSSTNILNASPYFVTFGATTGTTPTTVFFTRARRLKFRSNTGQVGTSVHVYVDGTLRSQYTATSGAPWTTYQSYGLLDTAGALLTATSSVGHYVSFEAETLGVSPLSNVEMVNIEPTHIGSSASSNRFLDATPDGSYVPIYGLGLYADYLNGYYPSVVATYQNRVVLSGLDTRPMLVLFSNIADSVMPGTYFNYFQITDDEFSLKATSPFDVELDKRGSDDRVVSIVEWQSSLFVLARRAAHRVSGSVEKVLSYDAKFVTFLTSTGCINPECVTKTEASIHYLGDGGLYELAPRSENGEYAAAELSLKISGKFGLSADPLYENTPWIKYDPTTKYIYVGYPATGNAWTSTYMYVYNTVRGAWTEYNTQGYFRVLGAASFIDRTLGQIFLCACTTEQKESAPDYGLPSNLILLKFNEPIYVDYYDLRTRASTSETYPTLQLPILQFTSITPWKQSYGYSYEKAGQFRGFIPSPIYNIEDVTCYITPPAAAARYLTFQSEWFKKPGDIFYVNIQQDVSTVVEFRWKPQNNLANSEGFTHMVCWVDNVLYTGWTSGGTGATNDKYFTLPSDVVVNSYVEWGFIYNTMYYSPLFVNDKLTNQKRLKHLYLYFDNKYGQEVYDVSDVNGGS